MKTRILLSAFLALATASCATTLDLDSLKKAGQVEVGFLPVDPPGTTSYAGSFGYTNPTDGRHYLNVFRMSNGRVLSIHLWPVGTNGVHTGDEIGIADVTDVNAMYLFHAPLAAGSEWSFELGGNRWYFLRGVEKGGEVFAVLTDSYGTSAAVSYPALYRGRAMHPKATKMIGDKSFGYLLAFMGRAGGSGVLFFSDRARTAALDPTAPLADLMPTYFVLHEKDGQKLDNMLIGNSGYRLKWNGTQYDAELAK